MNATDTTPRRAFAQWEREFPEVVERQERWARDEKRWCVCGHKAIKHPCLPHSMTGRPDVYGGCLADDAACPCMFFEEER